MAKRMRVRTAGTKPATQQRTAGSRTKRSVVESQDNPKPTRMTNKEIEARVKRRYATSTTLGAIGSNAGLRTAANTLDSGTNQFYSPQLSTDFLEKPQNLRERRAFYRFFYHTNEIVGQSIDLHSTLPMSKIRLVPPRIKNKKQSDYVFKFFEKMCDQMKLFKTLLEITHEYWLFGNCVPRSALLRTPEGFVHADTISVGDLVLTHNGRYRPVVKSCDRDADRILDIDVWKMANPLRVTDEHPVEVLRDGVFSFVPAAELSKDDWVRVTWPSVCCDVEKVDFIDDYHVQRTDKGYTVSFSFEKPRQAAETRTKMVGWLQTLQEPTVKTRKSLAEDLGVAQSTLNNVISQLNNEIGTDYHKRIGPKDWQQGSQVVWFPVTCDIDTESAYTITKTMQFDSPHQVAIDDDFAYLAGYWLGDGTLGRDSSRNNWGRGNWQIVFGKNSAAQYSRIRKILEKKLGSSCVKEWSSRGIRFLKIKSNPAFVEWWSKNFGDSQGSDNPKRIPLWFQELPKEKLKAFLAGIVDSDGCVSGREKTVVSMTMMSSLVMDVVREIALKCGAVGSYRATKARHVTLPQGTTTMSKGGRCFIARDEISCGILTEKGCKKLPENARFIEKGYFQRVDGSLAFKIKGISSSAGERVYNFEVEEDHTYQVNGISTHNCFVYAEEYDYTEDMQPEERAHKKEESRQRSKLLKEKYKINDNDPLFKGWKKLIVLPPDQVRVHKLPLSDDTAIEYIPDPETKKMITSEVPMEPDFYQDGPNLNYKIPSNIRDKVRQSGTIPLDTNPYTGSHVYHLARKKSQYEPLGTSIIERCINTLVLMDKLRQAQTSIASRHMTPMRIVWAEDLNPEDVDSLREQVDMALVDPDYSIIANYEVHWDEMGPQNRLLDIEAEYESNLQKLLAGLGITKEVLTGEGTYSGSRVSLEIMNQQYLLFREIISDYVENNLFKPIAAKKGFVEYDDYGNEFLVYPKLSFTRLSIRDNEQFFDAAFQLYQKGSVSIDLILDILNIDPTSTQEKIEHDMFTVNDSQFNEVLRNMYTNASTALIDNTNVIEKLAKYMNLEMAPKEEGKEEEGASRFSSKKGGNGRVNEEEFKKKMAKLVKYFRSNPTALDKVLSK